MKQLIGTIFLISFIFSGVNFNQSTVFSSLDEVNGPIVGNAMGVDFDMNESMSIGYDSILGMLVKAKSPMGIEFRIGFSATDTATYGVGYTWWNGGEGIKTSLSTIIDYATAGNNAEETFIRINLNWGF